LRVAIATYRKVSAADAATSAPSPQSAPAAAQRATRPAPPRARAPRAAAGWDRHDGVVQPHEE
jgi:hypothetical protein